MIASAVALSFISDITGNANAGTYNGAIGWLLFVAIAGIIVQGVTVIFHGLYFVEIIKNHFLVFAVVVSLTVFCTATHLYLFINSSLKGKNKSNVYRSTYNIM